MTATTTQGESLSRANGRVPKLDSPAVSARARARIAATDRDANRLRRLPAAMVSRLAGWWAWTASPASLVNLWTASAVNRRRIPRNNGVLWAAWQVSNWTDRLLMFILIAAAPTFLQGPLRWGAERPARRYGIYLTLAALTAAYLTGRK